LNIWVRKVDKAKIDKNSDSKDSSLSSANGTSATVGAVEELELKDGELVQAEKEEVKYRYINLGAKNTASMRPGERIIIHTPGGGGWGKEGEESQVEDRKDPQHSWKQGSIAGRQATAEASA